MFCPSCGTRIPEGVRFCKACGADLSARSATAPQIPAPGAPAFARPAAAARGRSAGRRRVIAGIAEAVAIALVVAVGLRTSSFGLAQPHLMPGTYTFTGNLVDSSLASHTTTMVLSVAEGDSVTFTFERGQRFGGNARVSWAGRDHLYVQVPVTRASLGLGENSKPEFTNVTDSLKSVTALSLGDDQPLVHPVKHVHLPAKSRDVFHIARFFQRGGVAECEQFLCLVGRDLVLVLAPRCAVCLPLDREESLYTCRSDSYGSFRIT